MFWNLNVYKALIDFNFSLIDSIVENVKVKKKRIWTQIYVTSLPSSGYLRDESAKTTQDPATPNKGLGEESAEKEDDPW